MLFGKGVEASQSARQKVRSAQQLRVTARKLLGLSLYSSALCGCSAQFSARSAPCHVVSSAARRSSLQVARGEPPVWQGPCMDGLCLPSPSQAVSPHGSWASRQIGRWGKGGGGAGRGSRQAARLPPVGGWGCGDGRRVQVHRQGGWWASGKACG